MFGLSCSLSGNKVRIFFKSDYVGGNELRKFVCMFMCIGGGLRFPFLFGINSNFLKCKQEIGS